MCDELYLHYLLALMYSFKIKFIDIFGTIVRGKVITFMYPRYLTCVVG